MSGHSQRGFTLLEILVALAVLALAMSAIIKAASDYTAGQSHLRDRTMATWVARNVLAEFQVRKDWPSVGEQKGTMDMGKREWRWLARTSQTEEAELRRLDVEVTPADSDSTEPLTTLSGFLMQPP
ncbi:MAG TPA: type II secretion system minor pseudopilin GspI [Gammaproteobacteria bacterium]|nr:type II secretion system minor pseudopilin GspI [Gammaproteobacteria bacterium]